MQAQKEREEYESKNKGDFELIYPCDKSYEEYLQHSQKLYEDWTGASTFIYLFFIRYKKELKKRFDG